MPVSNKEIVILQAFFVLEIYTAFLGDFLCLF